MVFEEIWDYIVEGWEYLISFEWLTDIWEFFGSMFENLGDFSVIGLTLGLVGSGVIYLARDYMLKPFLIHMSPMGSIFWGGATYLGTFAAGYLMGKHFDNT